jgi:hypothetical protein
MCWRDDVVAVRYCSTCGQEYYGDLGHRGCPGPRVKAQVPVKPAPELCDECKVGPSPHKCKFWLVKATKEKAGKICECECTPPF